MEFYSAPKKTFTCHSQVNDGTGEHHLKWS
jgi:hypothetical protein